MAINDATTARSETHAGKDETTFLAIEWVEHILAGEMAPAQGAAMQHLKGTPTLRYLRARMASARRWGDAAAELDACLKIEQHLGSARGQWELLLEASSRALALGDDDLRRERLAVWLASAAEHVRAARLLEELAARASDERAQRKLLVQASRFFVRGGDHQGAIDVLLAAASRHPNWAAPLELAGAVGGAAADPHAARWMLDAADRHEAKGDLARALEARRRAFELAPQATEAAEALSSSIVALGRRDAADELLKRHAAMVSSDSARQVHAARLSRALGDGDGPRALGVVLDGRLELDASEQLGAMVDAAMERTGLHEARLARAELLASTLEGAARATAMVSIARLLTGKLALPDRAMQAWIEAVASAPSCEEALKALRQQAHGMADPNALVEGLLRAATGAAEVPLRVGALLELTTMAEQQLADACIGTWALTRLLELEPSDQLRERHAALEPHAQKREHALAQARDVAQRAPEAERAGALVLVASLLQGRPELVDEYLAVLAELAGRGAALPRHWLELERASMRANRLDVLRDAAAKQVTRASTPEELIHLASICVILAVRTGDLPSALVQANGLQRAVPDARLGHAFAWILGCALGDDAVRASALETLAASASLQVRPTLLSSAGELHAMLGRDGDAERLANLAREAGPSDPRALAFAATISSGIAPSQAAAIQEKAWSVLVPDGRHHRAAVALLSQVGEHKLAHAWARRWYQLRPWDAQVLETLVQTALATSDAETLGHALDAVVGAMLPVEHVAPVISAGLHELVRLAPSAATAVARKAFEHLGPAVPELRAALLEAASQVRDDALEVDILERALATHPDASLAERLAQAFFRMGDIDGQAHALAAAAVSGADPSTVLAWAERLEPASGDAALALIEAKAIALEQVDQVQAQRLWTELGHALWQAADDRLGAVDAWERASKMAKETPMTLAARETVDRLGAAEAGDLLEAYGRMQPQPREASWTICIAAALALRAAEPSVAIDRAFEALSMDPQRTDALLIIEHASEHLGVPEPVDRAYRLAADGARGRFGRRAAHYRAARMLDQRGFPELAIVHATTAFEADPSEGPLLALLLRLGETVEPGNVIEALRRVAERSSSDLVRSVWLRRAARLAIRSVQHSRDALDIALVALHTYPDVEAAELCAQAAARLVEEQPDDRMILELRLRNVQKALVPKLEGPHGARVAIVFARLCAARLEATQLGMAWAAAALACSGDIDEYSSLEPVAARLAEAQDDARAFIDEASSRADAMRGTTGSSLFSFALSLAAEMGDEQRAAQLKATQEHLERREQEQPSTDDFFGGLDDELAEEAPQVVEPPAPPAEPEQEPQSPAVEHEASGAVEPESEAAFPPERRTSRGIGALPYEPPTVGGDPLERAAKLEGTGQVAAAIRVLELEAERQPDKRITIDQWLRRLYSAAGKNSQLGLVLGRLVDHAEDLGEKMSLLLEAASLHEARGEIDVARARWQQLGDLDPAHPAAAAFLERDAVQRGDLEHLAWLLERRAEASVVGQDVRALRLRRAMLLDQQLGRPEDAIADLDGLLKQLGDEAGVLRVRADITERVRNAEAAAPYWARAARVAANRSEAVVFASRAAAAQLQSGNEAAARESISMVSDSRSEEVLGILAELARRAQDKAQLAGLLDELATVSKAELVQRARWLVESSNIALELSEPQVALERAQRAARMSDDPRVQLHLVLTSYRVEGLVNRTRVEAMLTTLGAVGAHLQEDELALHAFLVAEMIEVLRGRDAAIDLLVNRQRHLGLRPLIALGLAERHAAQGNPETALPLFDAALEARDLYGVRSFAQVAFAAAKAALRASGPARAAAYVSEVERHPEAKALAERLRAEMAELVPSTDEMRRQLERIARESTGLERARALYQSGRLAGLKATRASNAEADSYFAEAIAAAGADPDLRQRIAADRAALRSKMSPSELPPPIRSSFPPGKPSSRPPPAHHDPGVATAALREVSSSQDLFAETGRASIIHPPTDAEQEHRLFAELAAGSMEAGDQLAALLADEPARTHDLVAVRRRQVVLEPGRLERMVQLRDAALADHGIAHAKAVEHVIHVLMGREALKPPPLALQQDEPERLVGMIFRGVHTAATELLADIWDSASHLFSKAPSDYGITGLERVAVNAPSALARAYAAASHALGSARTPVFQQRNPGALRISVALLTPPALVVQGAPDEESPELQYRMAAMLTAAMPRNVLLFGQPEAETRRLLDATNAAFGPPNLAKSKETSTAVLAGELWHALPGRVQRALHEVLRVQGAFDYDQAWARAVQSTRRGGLFVVGNLRVALMDCLEDPGLQSAIDVDAPDALRTLCSMSASAADLVRFATSAEYAEARWRDPTTRTRSSQNVPIPTRKEP